LAPENVKAFFVQRERWARGAIQIMFQAAGPLGTGLTLMQRLLFLPTHWLTHSLMFVITIVAPIVSSWTGTPLFVNMTTPAALYYVLPMVLAIVGGLWVYAPREYFPFAAQVLGTFQSFKVLPAVLAAIVKPSGHVFKVTPKGAEARQSEYERGVFWTAAALLMLTAGGLIINTIPEWRVVSQAAPLSMLAFWAILNCVVLLLVCMMSLQAPIRRVEERFQRDEPIWIFAANGALSTGRTRDISLSGVGITIDADRALAARVGEPVRVFLPEVGFVAGTAVRQSGNLLGVKFDLPPSLERDLLIRKLFTTETDNIVVHGSALSATIAILRSIWSVRSAPQEEVSEAALAAPSEKLPPQSLVVQPRSPEITLEAIVAARRAMAA
jgi:cellulose synthase (UDP-forming)